MAFPPTQPNHLDREFLPIRAKILEIASALDRIQRNDDNQNDDNKADDLRWQQLQAGIKILLEPETQPEPQQRDRAEQVQLLFSRRYDEQWRETLKVPS